MDQPQADPQDLTTAAPPPAAIRPFNIQTDLKLVRYLVGASVMEPSSLANQAALFTPYSILACLALSHFLITRYTSGYPALVHNYIYPNAPKALNLGSTYGQTIADFLLIIPLLIAPPIAILAVFEWRHRNLFEMEMRRTIGEEDLRDIEAYYNVESEKAAVGGVPKKPAKGESTSRPEERKGFWVLEYDNRLIGAVGLDGRKPGQPLDSVVDQIIASAEASKKAKKSGATLSADAAGASGETSATADSGASNLRSRTKQSTPSVSVTPPTPSSGTSPASFTLDPSASLPEGTLHLRRFATSMSFRSAGIEDELLDFVAKYAFASTDSPIEPAKQIVVTLRPTVQKSMRKVLERHGFEFVPKGSELEVPIVGGPRAAIAKKHVKTIAERLWPLDLGARTMVLKRSTWDKTQQ
ncbi:acyl-CoA N-acyltransferase domain protein [Rhodotorula toruloides]|uniref:Acyl-CoA N-acyltransferase domain protein n=1 Tax=Rhodotorula toruloides TaxID=5286 RepID=A0A511KHT5_RHOTO|nr:acyl-CoA N-acyltransferase domain protein [Rhodotorula toruloides]